MPEAFYWIMIFLTFPTGLIIMYVFGVLIYVLTEIVGLDFGSSFAGLVFTWVVLVIGGHLQWKPQAVQARHKAGPRHCGGKT